MYKKEPQKENLQVKDNPELLTLMLEDAKKAPRIYHPTNYWSVYEKILLPELRKYGLYDFRRRKKRYSILGSLGASDLIPVIAGIDLFKSSFFSNAIFERIPGYGKMITILNNILNKSCPLVSHYSLENLQLLSFEYVRNYGEKNGAKPLNEFEASQYGNPEDTFKINGNVYTTSLLGYYMRYAYCCRFINFDNVKIFVELGSGAGKQIEVLKKLHPHISFVIFDLSPQLYICQQYLNAVFPENIVPYEKTRSMNNLNSLDPGKIYLFGNWKFPILEGIPIDLFWNTASFQEMEPNVVANYLSFIKNNAQAVFLNEVMEGKHIAKKEGKGGVMRPTKLEDYKKALIGFDLLDLSLAVSPFGKMKKYYDSFWKKTLNGILKQTT